MRDEDDDDDDDDGLNAARGMLFAMILALPFWACVGVIVRAC